MLRGYYRTFYVHTFLTLSFTRSQCSCLDGMFCIFQGVKWDVRRLDLAVILWLTSTMVLNFLICKNGNIYLGSHCPTGYWSAGAMGFLALLPLRSEQGSCRTKSFFQEAASKPRPLNAFGHRFLRAYPSVGGAKSKFPVLSREGVNCSARGNKCVRSHQSLLSGIGFPLPSPPLAVWVPPSWPHYSPPCATVSRVPGFLQGPLPPQHRETSQGINLQSIMFRFLDLELQLFPDVGMW